MTEGFRCRDCERVLTYESEFALGSCNDCEPPLSHEYEDDGYGSCAVCGVLPPELHRQEMGPLVPEAEIRECPECRHYQHDGACWGAEPAWPKPKPCLCPVRKAVA